MGPRQPPDGDANETTRAAVAVNPGAVAVWYLAR